MTGDPNLEKELKKINKKLDKDNKFWQRYITDLKNQKELRIL